jgi:ribosome-binding protein aMBF1 (putative translation factor)
MARCEVCGNEYKQPMEVHIGDRRGIFDSFECAIHAMAPVCSHCGCRIIGHGVEADDGKMFCCAHCAEAGEVGHVRARASGSNLKKDPEEWKTGDEPSTDAQLSYLKTLSDEAGQEFVESKELTKAEAAKQIEALQRKTGRGQKN